MFVQKQLAVYFVFLTGAISRLKNLYSVDQIQKALNQHCKPNAIYSGLRQGFEKSYKPSTISWPLQLVSRPQDLEGETLGFLVNGMSFTT